MQTHFLAARPSKHSSQIQASLRQITLSLVSVTLSKHGLSVSSAAAYRAEVANLPRLLGRSEENLAACNMAYNVSLEIIARV